MTPSYSRRWAAALASAVGFSLILSGECFAGDVHADVFWDDQLAELVATYHLAGLAVAAIEGEQSTTAVATGVGADVLSDTTLFNVASVSKVVTALSVLALQSQFQFELDDTANSVLRSWTLSNRDNQRSRATVRQLLSHTAGTNRPSAPWFPADSAMPKLTDVLNGVAGQGPRVYAIGPPGEKWSYSGGGYLVLQQIVEDVSGQPFESFVKSNVFEPLGMDTATFAPSDAELAQSAPPFDATGRELEKIRLLGAAGGMFASAEDLKQLLRAYCDQGELLRETGIVNAAQFRALHAPVAAVAVPGRRIDDVTYGLGHSVYRKRDQPAILFHSGGNPGYAAYFLVVPRRNTGIAILSNSDAAAAAPAFLAILDRWAKSNELQLPPIF